MSAFASTSPEQLVSHITNKNWNMRNNAHLGFSLGPIACSSLPLKKNSLRCVKMHTNFIHLYIFISPFKIEGSALNMTWDFIPWVCTIALSFATLNSMAPELNMCSCALPQTHTDNRQARTNGSPP